MSVVVSLALVLLASISLATLVHEKASKFVTLFLFGIPLALYIFYALDILVIGKYIISIALLVFVLFSIVYGIWKAKGYQRFISLLKTSISPAIVIFIFCCIALYFITQDKKVNLCDELRLWGAYPKILFYTNRLQLGPDALLYSFMQSYPPIMPIFIYFLSGFSEQFNEAHIFWGYGVIMASVLFHLFENITWKQWADILPGVGICLVIPIIFYSSGANDSWVYRSLYIDPILGVIVGYLFYLAVLHSKHDRYIMISHALTALFVVLIKDSGILFAVMSAVPLLFRKRICNKLRSPMILLLLFIVAYISWKLLLYNYHVNDSVAFGLNFDWLQTSAIKPLFGAFGGFAVFTLDFLYVKCTLSFLVLSVILGLANYYIIKKQDTERKHLVYASISYIVSNVLFIFGYLMIYYEREFASFSRYMGTLLLGYVVFLLMIVSSFHLSSKMKEIPSISEKYHLKAFVLSLFHFKRILIVIFAIIILMQHQKIVIEQAPHEQAKIHSQTIIDKIDYKFTSTQPAKVYIVFDGNFLDNVTMHHRIYLNLIGSRAHIKNVGHETVISVDEGDIIENRRKVEKSITFGDYDYVYFVSVSPVLNEQFGSWVTEERIEAGLLYLVNHNDGSFSLIEET